MATVAPPVGGPTVDPQHLTVIAAACRDGECLRFAYSSRDASDTRRNVEPHSLVNLGRRWYLVAWDRGREDWRTFRVDRVRRPASTGVRFKQRALPVRDAAAYVQRRITAMPHSYEARITVHAPAADIQPPWATVTPIDDQSCELRTGDDNLAWLAMRVAMLPADFEVHEPPELAEHLRSLAARLSRATGGTVPGVAR
jgi:predicted DNA-binding transcriptional regulator YafY